MFWLIFSLISALSFALQGTFTYYLTTKQKKNSVSLNTVYHIYIVIIALIISCVVYFIKPSQVGNIYNGIGVICKNYLILGIIAGILALTGNVLIYSAYAAGPNVNPGVMTSIGNGAIILSILLPAIFYAKKISSRQIFGIIVLLISFVMLSNDKFNGFGELFGKKSSPSKK